LFLQPGFFGFDARFPIFSTQPKINPMKTYTLARGLSASLIAWGFMASLSLNGNITIVENFESFDLGSQSANTAGTFNIVGGLTGSDRAAEITTAFRHNFNWAGAGQTVSTFSFDFFNSSTGDPFTDARVVFALNQNSNSNILTGTNNLIRMVVDTQAGEAGGVFAFQQSIGASFVNNSYPLDTLITVHFILNNTSEPATNLDGVTVAANSVQLWTEINGGQTRAGSANLTADRADSNLILFGIGAFSAYDRSSGFVIDNLRFQDGIAVVPEPSTYAALAGLLALAFVFVRRRLLRKS